MAVIVTSAERCHRPAQIAETVFGKSGSDVALRLGGEQQLHVNDPVTDASGEALYIRDEESGRFWSPTPLMRENSRSVAG